MDIRKNLFIESAQISLIRWRKAKQPYNVLIIIWEATADRTEDAWLGGWLIGHFLSRAET